MKSETKARNIKIALRINLHEVVSNDLSKIMRYYGFERCSDTIRYLIREEARRIEKYE